MHPNFFQREAIMRHDTEFCSFCGKGRSEVLRLVRGPTVFICDVCIAECVRALAVGAVDVFVGEETALDENEEV